MKLAIICEMPDSGKEDLSANAEKSAQDAFAYCHGPFSGMEFVRRSDKSASDKVHETAHWILLMGHDCLVDIQAFEVFAETVALSRGRNIDEVLFPRWTSSGLAGDCSQFSFQRTPFAWLESPAPAKRRILIEPE